MRGPATGVITGWGMSVEASVIIVNHNGRDDLATCLPSVLSQSIDVSYEVILVDNDSDDGSVAFVRDRFPDVRVVENDANRWFSGGNNDGLAIANGTYLAFVNPDADVDDDWLETLLAPFESDDDHDVGLTTSRIVRGDDRTRLNTCGNVAHYTGLGFCRGLDERVDAYPDAEQVGAVSGCSFAMARDVYDAIGGFDETFEMYLEDIDISWRARLAGYDIVYVPESVVYHEYELGVPAWKLFNLERNRYLVLLKHLRTGTLARLLPGLLLTELFVWLFAASRGGDTVLAKASAMKWLWQHRSTVRDKRERVQTLRERTDRELLAGLAVGLPLDQLGVPSGLRPILDPLVRAMYRPWYWLAVRS